MQASEVLTLVHAMDELGVVCWLDGGWGVDCLVGEQTREHSDLDLVVGRSDVDRVMGYLEHHGYGAIRDWLPTSIAFRDQACREVDLHPVDLTADGGGRQVLQDGSTWHYSAPVEGAIAGRTVRCASPRDQLMMHLGYNPRPVDFVDVRRIGDRFDLPLPPPFDTAIDDQE
jgi:lincosamide nucleotidyltransferase A/C/D/E